MKPSIPSPRLSFRNFVCATLAGIALSASAADNRDHNKTLPEPYLPALEQAVDKLAGPQAAAATNTLRGLAEDAQQLPVARATATWALAKYSEDHGDYATAKQCLEKLANDKSMPQFHRELAQRKLQERERVAKGKAARDPAEFRVKLPTLPKPGVTYHVSAKAGTTGDGSASQPFATLQQAQAAARAELNKRRGHWPKGGVSIVIGGGVYPINDTLVLSAMDSGSAETPMVYQAKPGEKPVFEGGVRVTQWQLLSNQQLKEKLEPTARDRVWECDLSALAVTDWGDPTTLRQAPELFCNGQPQTLARWPNEGFVKMGEELGVEKVKDGGAQGCKDGKFRYLEDRPSRWASEADVRLYGYWFWDWFEEFQKVAAIDTAAKTMTLSPPYSNYGYRRGQRYYALNLFSEIDQPGEWYLDRSARKVYWLPSDGIDPRKAEVFLSVCSKPFITIKDARNIIIEGLQFQNARGDALRITGGEDCLVAGCTIRQCGGDGIVIQGGTHHGIFGTQILTMGCGGTAIQGGDRKELVAGQHFVENCWIHDISRLKRTYTPAVLVDGCGNRVAHNLFEDMPSSAMRVEGNDHVIELNRVRHVVRESDDQGGYDAFGNPMYRGVQIRWNHWVDIGGGTGCGAAGVRLDDVISGVAIYGNIFERCGAVQFGGVQIHGGKENWIDGNAFIECFAGLSFSRWGEKRWLAFLEKHWDQAQSAPYVAKYPELARLRQDYDANCISRNIFAGCKDLFLRDSGSEQCLLNQTMDQRLEPALLEAGREIRKIAQANHALIDPIPWSEMGPYPHPWRAFNAP